MLGHLLAALRLNGIQIYMRHYYLSSFLCI